MLLKVGVAMMLVSLVLAAGVAAAVVLIRNEDPETTAVSAASRAASEKSAQKKAAFDPGQKLEIDDEDDEPAIKESASKASKKPAPPTEAPPETPAFKFRSEPSPAPALAPEPIPDWPEPTAEEVAAANAPRYYQPTAATDMTLTIEALGLYEVPVISSPSYEVLDRGLMHEPESSLPWDGGAGRNVFLAGHFLGWPGTASHLVFYNLDKLRGGEDILLRDGWGRAYRYRVSESFGATPLDSWVMGQEVGRDMLTLQTCIPPSFEERLVVRADRA
jgi:sortase A